MARSSKRSEENDALLAAMGERIAVRRAGKRMSQRELAAVCNVDIKTISRIELGDISPSIITLVSIAQVLELSLDYLVYGTERKLFQSAEAYVLSQEQIQEQMDNLRRRLEGLERQRN